ncbi:MAG: acyl-CoA dehydrogenase family protein [Pseudomonadota bacterium]
MNQPPLRGDVDLWTGDPVLVCHAAAAGADVAKLSEIGRAWGRLDIRAMGRDAERHPPEAILIDRGGRRLDEVSFHPAYHRLMALGLEAGYAALPWEPGGGGHATHAALVYLTTLIEPGVACPMTMTYAAYPALGAGPALAAKWRPKILSRRYDPSVRPISQKLGGTLGMAMTERTGGSDVRANTTRAEPDGEAYALFGHKWFCSAPMSDGFLTLAQAPGGLTCFLVPRWLDDGRNAIRIDRLKDKLGNRANASAEITYEGAWAERLGDEGAGVRTIIEMVHHTRLDTALAPAAVMRAALAEAHHWVAHRRAFQCRLVDQPLMRRVLADMVLDFEAAAALGFRVASAFDDPSRRGFARLAVALAKFLANKLCPVLVAEAMEVLGGMGYVEDTPLPMLYREAPLNGIWEGSGNVIALDILRTLERAPGAADAFHAELAAACGTNRVYDAAVREFEDAWRGAPDAADARRFATRAAQLLSASVLIRTAPAAVADAYVATRLTADKGQVYEGSPAIDEAAILARLGPPE